MLGASLPAPVVLTPNTKHQKGLELASVLGRVQGSGFRVQGSGFRVQGSGSRVQGSRVQGEGCRDRGIGVGWAAEIVATRLRGPPPPTCGYEGIPDSGRGIPNDTLFVWPSQAGKFCEVQATVRCRTNSARVRQSRPDSDLGSQAKA